jgi:hypothetical protein
MINCPVLSRTGQKKGKQLEQLDKDSFPKMEKFLKESLKKVRVVMTTCTFCENDFPEVFATMVGERVYCPICAIENKERKDKE